MSFGSAWFWTMYLIAAAAAAVAIVSREAFDPRVARTIAGVVVLFAGAVVGISVRGCTLDLSGHRFALPTPPPSAPRLAAFPAPRIAGPDPYIGINVFASVLDQTRPLSPTLTLRRQDALMVVGWALDTKRAVCGAIDLLVDSQAYEAASLIERPDVAIAYGQQARDSGFRAVLPLAGFHPGTHRISVVCVDETGGATSSATRFLSVTQ